MFNENMMLVDPAVPCGLPECTQQADVVLWTGKHRLAICNACIDALASLQSQSTNPSWHKEMLLTDQFGINIDISNLPADARAMLYALYQRRAKEEE